jgi:putative chitinase
MNPTKEQINKVVERYGIKDVPAFLANCHHESEGFTKFVENLNYKVSALISLFSRKRISEQQCRAYGRTDTQKAKQEAIANTIYGGEWGRINLGNLVYGDGWKHRGAGAIQLTGKSNQEKYFASIGEPCLPEKLQTLEYALDSAGWFWKTKRIDLLPTFKEKCIAVNGGVIGLEERKALYEKYKKELV